MKWEKGSGKNKRVQPGKMRDAKRMCEWKVQRERERERDWTGAGVIDNSAPTDRTARW